MCMACAGSQSEEDSNCVLLDKTTLRTPTQQKGQWLPGVRREAEMEPRGRLGQGDYSVWHRHDGRMSLDVCMCTSARVTLT